MENKLAIIMCVWKRVNLLPKTLKLLSKQKYNEFDLFIWNNNRSVVEQVDLIIKNTPNINISVKHSKDNVGGIGRFYYAKEIAKNGYDKVIFIDDDQTFDENFILDCLNVYEKKSYKSWWAWKAKDEYFNRVRCQKTETPNYCGTGGAICDISVFCLEDFYKSFNSKYHFIEDLWLSYYTQHILNWKLGVIQTNITIDVDGKDQYTKLKSLKNEFYKQLKNTGWQTKI